MAASCMQVTSAGGFHQFGISSRNGRAEKGGSEEESAALVEPPREDVFSMLPRCPCRFPVRAVCGSLGTRVDPPVAGEVLGRSESKLETNDRGLRRPESEEEKKSKGGRSGADCSPRTSTNACLRSLFGIGCCIVLKADCQVVIFQQASNSLQGMRPRGQRQVKRQKCGKNARQGC
eukprot:6193182-Pleurochrysis_carterae.AAC.3